MKKVLLILTVMFTLCMTAQAYQSPNQRIDNIGAKLLEANGINKKIIFGLSAFSNNKVDNFFIYDLSLLADYDLHNNRNAYIFSCDYNKMTSDDEVAALLAHNIAQTVHSYTGVLNGQFMFTKNGAFPFNYIAKKNELQFDKTAVDYLVKAGYNPVALITAYSKTLPEWRSTIFARHNKADKRMMAVYNYINANYSEYLNDNEFTKSIYYVRFLRTHKANL